LYRKLGRRKAICVSPVIYENVSCRIYRGAWIEVALLSSGSTYWPTATCSCPETTKSLAEAPQVDDDQVSVTIGTMNRGRHLFLRGLAA
jgi:hypothetical protein